MMMMMMCFLIMFLLSLSSLARRRRLRRVLSVCRGRSRFEGCFSRKFFFFFFFSTKTENWRKKWVLLNDVGKNTNHFIETLFSRRRKRRKRSATNNNDDDDEDEEVVNFRCCVIEGIIVLSVGKEDEDE